jgi:hypothetical protein
MFKSKLSIKKCSFCKKDRIIKKKKTGHTIAFFPRALLKIGPEKDLL